MLLILISHVSNALRRFWCLSDQLIFHCNLFVSKRNAKMTLGLWKVSPVTWREHLKNFSDIYDIFEILTQWQKYRQNFFISFSNFEKFWNFASTLHQVVAWLCQQRRHQRITESWQEICKSDLYETPFICNFELPCLYWNWTEMNAKSKCL